MHIAARLDAGPTAGDKVCTLRGKDVHVNTWTMSVFLNMVGADLGPADHAVLIIWTRRGGTGAARSRSWTTVLLLPPYSPELNPVERFWGYLRSHYLPAASHGFR